jgi:hypothetical protein
MTVFLDTVISNTHGHAVANLWVRNLILSTRFLTIRFLSRGTIALLVHFFEMTFGNVLSSLNVISLPVRSGGE